MEKVLKVIGIILVIAGACLGAFTGLPVAQYTGIAVAMIGAAMTIVSAYKQAEKKDWKLILSIVLIGAGSFICGICGISSDVITEVITAVIGVIVLIAGIIIPIVSKKLSKSEE